MKTKISQIFPYNSAFFWLGISLLFWWMGFSGRDLYFLPATIFFILSVVKILKGNFFYNQIHWLYKDSNKKYVLAIFWFHVGLFLVITILRYYSFQWNVWDVGNHSNMLFNISRGHFYSSYFNTHNWGDHFTPSMSPLALFYLLAPSTHWLTIAKTISYLSIPILIYKFSKNSFSEKSESWKITILIGSAWMLFYSPALNSFFYEFQASSLAPPFIIYAFLCFQQKKWIIFWFMMIILLGFKEHLGAVWIGIGCHMILNTKYIKTGLFLIIGGAISIYLIMFHVMPFFRNYEESWSMPFGPFVDFPRKVIYLFKLLIPLGFLPLIYWRLGILAAPAIGVNLLSNNPAMYSTSFHYDDISSTLLMMSVLNIFARTKFKIFKLEWLRNFREWLLIFWILITLSLLSSSPLREFYASIPKKEHWLIRKELIKFDKLSSNEAIAVQTSLGTQLYRKKISAISQKNGKCGPVFNEQRDFKPVYLVFAKSLNHYLIKDLEECLNELNLSKDHKRITGFNSLVIYKKQ